jgi:hypothetical protein
MGVDVSSNDLEIQQGRFPAMETALVRKIGVHYIVFSFTVRLSARQYVVIARAS